MKKFISLLLSSLMALALIASVAPVLEETASAAEVNLLNVSTTDLNGNAFSGSTFGDYDLTLLNVWATWCGPCLGEMPALQQIYTELEPRGINIVGLLFDADSASYANEIVADKNLTYKTLLPGDSTELATLSSVGSIPVTYYVNKDGNVRDTYTHVGSQSYEDWLKNIVAVMYWEYGIEMSDIAPIPSPTPGGETYTFDASTGVLTVSGTSIADYVNDSASQTNVAPWHGLTGIKKIIVEEGIEYIGSYAFQRIPLIESISLPSTLRYIAKDAFYYMNVVDLVIPEGVTTMKAQSVYCSHLYLPSTLTSIPDVYFLTYNCTKLESITVAAGNPILCSVDGVLYSKDKSELLHYPALKTGTEFTTLPETDTICTYAIGQSARLKTLNLSKNITTLEVYAIYSMSLLRQVYFYGDWSADFSENAIDSCKRLSTIYYPENAVGWGSTFCGIPTATFKPVTTLLGDVNGDASVTQTDALLLLRTLAGWTTTIDTAAADINGDTSVTQTDALLLLRYLAGWPVAQFPA